MFSNKSLPPTPDRTTDPQHDGYKNLPGPVEYPTGSPEHAEMLGYLAALTLSETLDKPVSTLNVPVSPIEAKERESRTPDKCPRAVKQIIEDGDTMQVVFLPCNARTCDWCKDAVDERDATRLIHSLGTDAPCLATIPARHWERIRKRAQRAGVVAVKMATRTAHDEIAVVMSGPIVKNARRVDIGTVIELVEKRPPNAPLTELDYENGKIKHRPGGRRVHMTGPGLVSVKKWESEGSPGERVKHRAAPISKLVTQESAEICAHILGFRTQRIGHNLKILGHWDSDEAKAFRDWARDPDGALRWERIRYEIDSTTEEPPPLEDAPPGIDDRQLEFSGVA